MHRLQRRRIILERKREGAFDPHQYWFESAERGRLARRLRARLRAGQPAVLLTPRWSDPPTFLDDLAVDLSLGEPTVVARPLNLAPLAGLTTHQAWAWLVDAVAGFCRAPLREGAAWQAVSRRGFRSVLAELFTAAEEGPRRCLMLHGLQHLNVEAAHDLLQVFEEHVQTTGPQRRFNLLFAGSIDAPHINLPGVRRAELADFSPPEAVEALVELLGPADPARLASVVALVGGVPAILAALGSTEPSQLSTLLTDRDAMWRALGGLADEVRAAIDIANGDPRLARRLEGLARQGALERDPLDAQLQRAGLVRCAHDTTSLRTPWFADLVLAG